MARRDLQYLVVCLIVLAAFVFLGRRVWRLLVGNRERSLRSVHFLLVDDPHCGTAGTAPQIALCRCIRGELWKPVRTAHSSAHVNPVDSCEKILFGDQSGKQARFLQSRSQSRPA